MANATKRKMALQGAQETQEYLIDAGQNNYDFDSQRSGFGMDTGMEAHDDIEAKMAQEAM